jgi:hypothetical protein
MISRAIFLKKSPYERGECSLLEIEHAELGPDSDGDGVALRVGGDERRRELRRAAHLRLLDGCVLHGCSGQCRELGGDRGTRV